MGKLFQQPKEAISTSGNIWGKYAPFINAKHKAHIFFPLLQIGLTKAEQAKIIKNTHVQNTDFIFKIHTDPKSSIIFIALVIFAKIRSAVICLVASVLCHSDKEFNSKCFDISPPIKKRQILKILFLTIKMHADYRGKKTLCAPHTH